MTVGKCPSHWCDSSEQMILFNNGVLVSDKIELYGIWVPTVFQNRLQSLLIITLALLGCYTKAVQHFCTPVCAQFILCGCSCSRVQPRQCQWVVVQELMIFSTTEWQSSSASLCLHRKTSTLPYQGVRSMGVMHQHFNNTLFTWQAANSPTWKTSYIQERYYKETLYGGIFANKCHTFSSANLNSKYLRITLLWK